MINIKPKIKPSIIFYKTLRDLHSILRVKLLQWWWISSVFFLRGENWCFPNVCKNCEDSGLLVCWCSRQRFSSPTPQVVFQAFIINTCLLCTVQLLYSFLVNSAYSHLWAICVIYFYIASSCLFSACAWDHSLVRTGAATNDYFHNPLIGDYLNDQSINRIMELFMQLLLQFSFKF